MRDAATMFGSASYNIQSVRLLWPLKRPQISNTGRSQQQQFLVIEVKSNRDIRAKAELDYLKP